MSPSSGFLPPVYGSILSIPPTLRLSASLLLFLALLTVPLCARAEIANGSTHAVPQPSASATLDLPAIPPGGHFVLNITLLQPPQEQESGEQSQPQPQPQPQQSRLLAPDQQQQQQQQRNNAQSELQRLIGRLRRREMPQRQLQPVAPEQDPEQQQVSDVTTLIDVVSAFPLHLTLTTVPLCEPVPLAPALAASPSPPSPPSPSPQSLPAGALVPVDSPSPAPPSPSAAAVATEAPSPPPCAPERSDTVLPDPPTRQLFLSVTAPSTAVLSLRLVNSARYATPPLTLYARRLLTPPTPLSSSSSSDGDSGDDEEGADTSSACPGAARDPDAVCGGAPAVCQPRATCKCPRNRAGRACGDTIKPLDEPTRSPVWDGSVRAPHNTTILRVPTTGVRVRARAASTSSSTSGGEPSFFAVRAHVLRGALLLDGSGSSSAGSGGAGRSKVVVVDSRERVLPLGLYCGDDDSGDRDARGEPATVVVQDTHANDNGGGSSSSSSSTANDMDRTFELVCVTRQQLPANGEVELRFDVGGDVGAAARSGRGEAGVVAITVERCGADGLIECPLGRHGESGLSAGAVVGIGVGVVVASFVLVGLGYCGCMYANRTLRGSTAGSVLHAAAWEVVIDDEKFNATRQSRSHRAYQQHAPPPAAQLAQQQHRHNHEHQYQDGSPYTAQQQDKLSGYNNQHHQHEQQQQQQQQAGHGRDEQNSRRFRGRRSIGDVSSARGIGNDEARKEEEEERDSSINSWGMKRMMWLMREKRHQEMESAREQGHRHQHHHQQQQQRASAPAAAQVRRREEDALGGTRNSEPAGGLTPEQQRAAQRDSFLRQQAWARVQQREAEERAGDDLFERTGSAGKQ